MSGRSAEPVTQNPFHFGAAEDSLGDVREAADDLPATTENFANSEEVDLRASGLSEQETNMDHSTANNNASSGNRTQAEFLETQVVYGGFLREGIRNEGLVEPEGFLQWSPVAAMATTGDEERPNLANVFAEEGRRLREIADAFTASPERAMVRALAESVDIRGLDRSQFMNLLNELFADGNITAERVALLFFYCRDLAIRALRTQLERIFCDLFNWSITYIFRWVTARGGWERVWSSSIGHSSSTIALAAVGITCILLAIFNHFHRNA